MSENLFSQYRPLIIDEIFGHDRIKKEIKERIKDNNLPKCIMITGKTGTGKTTLEKIISKSIFCKDKKDGNPCGVCDQCLTVINEKQSNYYYLFNASNLGIDEMRNIEELVLKKNLSTVQNKVIVIDEFQEIMSNQKASKNILKILERPMPNITFIILAMDESRINSAIKNRCVHYKLKDISYQEISNYLLQICEKEDIKIDTPDKANTLITIAQNSDGSMRTAISYLERCLYSELWNPKTVLDELGIISNDGLNIVMNQLLSGDVAIFDNEITKDILDKIRWILNILYKFKSGVSINSFQKGHIQGIKPVDTSIVNKTIETFNLLTYFPYVNQELIDFTLIGILENNKGQISQEVKVRERKRT